jgi:hypothetical protein
MRDDHVPIRPRGVVEGSAFLDRESLRDVNLNVLDVLAVPNRLEETIGEAKGQDILSNWALTRSVPKGFSITMRARSTRSASARAFTTARAALGGMLK